MIIYKDIITDDEMISDSYDLKEVDGVVYEADCTMIEEGGVDVDIGANASAEEAEEALDDQKVKVNNIVTSFRLQPTTFDKKTYLIYFKGYLKEVEKKLKEAGKTEDEIKDFKSRVQTYASKLLKDKKFDQNYEFYIGESSNPDGMVALLNYREDGTTPYFTFWKDGLTEMKV